MHRLCASLQSTYNKPFPGHDLFFFLLCLDACAHASFLQGGEFAEAIEPCELFIMEEVTACEELLFSVLYFCVLLFLPPPTPAGAPPNTAFGRN